MSEEQHITKVDVAFRAEPLKLTDIELLWKNGEGTRKAQRKRQEYYEGDHAILKTDLKYADKSEPSKLVTGWVANGVDSYVGGMTTIPWSLSAGEETDEDGLKEYQEIAKRENFKALNASNLESALIQGSAVETHLFVDGDIKIQSYPGIEWMIFRDGVGVIFFAIHRFVLPKGLSLEGEMRKSKMEQMILYDKKTITRLERVIAESAANDTASTALRGGNWKSVATPETHSLSMVPIVEWKINAKGRSFISDALMEQNDHYNALDSMSGDDLLRLANALLMTWGLDGKWLLDHAEEIQKLRMLPFAGGKNAGEQGAEYIKKLIPYLETDARIARTRENIHIEMDIPDVKQIVGATGDTSGIALELKFMPMKQKAVGMMAHLAKSMLDRVVLINERLTKINLSAIEDVTPSIQFNIPINLIEQWTSIGALTGIVSRETQLDLLDDVQDTQKELDRIEQEGSAAPETEEQVRNVVAINQAAVDQVAATLAPAVEDLMAAVSEQAILNLQKAKVLPALTEENGQG